MSNVSTAERTVNRMIEKFDEHWKKSRAVSRAENRVSTWTVDEIKNEFKDVFTGDGCLEEEYKIEIDPMVELVKLPKRRVPVAMMKLLREEIQSLVDREIIAPVDCSTDWMSGMVSVQKPNGKPRLCIDPRPLNKALKRNHFTLPTIDDIYRTCQKQRFSMSVM